MTIHLGYEMTTGHAVAIPLRHTAVIGLTQESGKTTTLEALITRAKLRAMAFVTKRGEGSFSIGRIIPPYFQEPAQDATQPLWQYVSSLLETTLQGEKLRMQRTSIMRVCDVSALKNMTWERPRSLADVARNIETAIPATRGGFEQSMLLQLREYFRMVLPEVEHLPKSTALSLQPGLNIMYLEKLSPQMQALVIASCLNWIRTREKHTVTIIPEGWKFLGEGHSSPAMGAAEQLIREGGVLENFLWLDSQDLVSIWTPIRKSLGVYILGRQGEINEAERTVKHLPTEVQKPKPSDIQRLRKGQFYVSWGERLRLVYVQPSWMDAGTAQLVAMTNSPAPPRPKSDAGDDEMWREQAERLETENRRLVDEVKRATDAAQIQASRADDLLIELAKERDRRRAAEASLDQLTQQTKRALVPISANPAPCPEPRAMRPDDSFIPQKIESADTWLREVWPLVRDSVVKDPAIVQVLTSFPQIEVVSTKKVVQLDGDTLRGRLANMIVSGLFDNPTSAADVSRFLRTTGYTVANSNLSRELKALTTMGFLIMTGNTKATAYTRVPGMKITSRTLETA